MDDARSTYLENEIRNASPQKLRLMLVEGALKFALQSRDHWQSDRLSEACESLSRCQQIVGELLSGLKDDQSELGRNVTAVYLYTFQTVTDILLKRESEKLDGVISVLEEERETWRQVCRQGPAGPAAIASIAEITAGELQAIEPLADPRRAPDSSAPAPTTAGGFSCEA